MGGNKLYGITQLNYGPTLAIPGSTFSWDQLIHNNVTVATNQQTSCLPKI